MSVTLLSSFPNSRIKPRPARTTGYTTEISLPAGATVLVSPASGNKTDLLLRNLDISSDIMYSYVALDIATKGFPIKPGEAAGINSPQNCYAYNPSIAPIMIALDEGLG